MATKEKKRKKNKLKNGCAPVESSIVCAWTGFVCFFCHAVNVLFGAQTTLTLHCYSHYGSPIRPFFLSFSFSQPTVCQLIGFFHLDCSELRTAHALQVLRRCLCFFFFNCFISLRLIERVPRMWCGRVSGRCYLDETQLTISFRFTGQFFVRIAFTQNVRIFVFRSKERRVRRFCPHRLVARVAVHTCNAIGLCAQISKQETIKMNVEEENNNTCDCVRQLILH